VHAFSDADPGSFLLFNTDSGKFTLLGTALRGVEARQMAQRDLVRYKARDGLEIPAWLTLPKGGKGRKLPMVVLVHGGPYLRGGQWAWDADSQFLASRGYLVVEPEFRGSQGYGWKLFRAGWKQWGLKMQDDVADAARWAIAQGLADAQRVCLAGASYGGYATLMGLIRDPELYRCGVAWAAVTDIGLMYELSWSDMADVWKQYGMPALIGDRVKDAEQLAATSPLQQAARLKQPLLLAWGGDDRRVPIEHGTRLRDALSKTNPDVEWIVYPGEGHGFFKPENRYDFWGRVERFLARQLAPQ
jgi:dipeptidyl aminopeptidase/acylaminoacyl peptidase